MLVTALARILSTPGEVHDDQRIQRLIQVFSDGNKDERSRAVEDLAKIRRPALDERGSGETAARDRGPQAPA